MKILVVQAEKDYETEKMKRREAIWSRYLPRVGLILY